MQLGAFEGNVVSTWCVEPSARDRKMQIMEDFKYIDPSGALWLVPRGRIVDGASIPEFLWGPMIGSPFTGDFRRASVIHDVACEDRMLTSDQVHLMFYHAMRCDGTSSWLAKTIYAAVRLFGPKWGEDDPALEQNPRNIGAFYELIQSSEFAVAEVPNGVNAILLRTQLKLRPYLAGG
jgi:hypothetical protein